MKPGARAGAALGLISGVFALLAAFFLLDPRARTAGAPPAIPLVDTNFLDTSTVRKSYADLVRRKEDLSDFDCYACHARSNPPVLRFDTNQNLIIPPAHSDIVMGHGSHGRNNNCFNCHNETNLVLLQTRDGHPVSFTDSQLLCGSCHGPTYRDWEAGAHGRTSGNWNQPPVLPERKICVNCHDPHSPHFPGRKPAPGPHPLRPGSSPPIETAIAH